MRDRLRNGVIFFTEQSYTRVSLLLVGWLYFLCFLLYIFSFYYTFFFCFTLHFFFKLYILFVLLYIWNFISKKTKWDTRSWHKWPSTLKQLNFISSFNFSSIFVVRLVRQASLIGFFQSAFFSRHILYLFQWNILISFCLCFTLYQIYYYLYNNNLIYL